MRKNTRRKNKRVKFKKSNYENIGNLTRKKRMRNAIFCSFIILICLITRIAWIQFVDGKELKNMAYTQQTLDRKINPRRGTIYDSTGENILAVSSTVETVTINTVS